MIMFTLKRLLAMRKNASGTNAAISLTCGAMALPFNVGLALPFLMVGAGLAAGAFGKRLERRARRKRLKLSRGSGKTKQVASQDRLALPEATSPSESDPLARSTKVPSRKDPK